MYTFPFITSTYDTTSRICVAPCYFYVMPNRLRKRICLFFLRGRSAARVAASKTSRTPSFVLADVSKYPTAPSLRATAAPCDSYWSAKRCVGWLAATGAQYLLWGHHALAGFPELLNGARVVSQVLPKCDEKPRHLRTKVTNFVDPLYAREHPDSP